MANTVVIIGAGGLGINIVTQIMDQMGTKHEGISFKLIDGSDSNMLNHADYMEYFELVPNVGGVGKVRRNGAEAYTNYVKENISKIAPATIYVLVYSLSGGTGSVLGPTLNNELMKKNNLTINVVLATDNSAKDVDNTFNTIAGLSNNVRQLQRPVHCMVEQSAGSKQSEVDLLLIENVLEAARIAGEKHLGLDGNDIRSFLDYQVHGIQPALTMIERFDSADAAKELAGSTITTLSLLSDSDNPRPDVGAVFNTDGVCPSGVDTHFITTTKNMDQLCLSIKERHEYYRSMSEGLNLRDVFGSADCDDALVL